MATSNVRSPRRSSLAGGLVATSALVMLFGSAFQYRQSAVWAATTETIVVDRNTGLAIGGFDPVAYFVDEKARPGDGAFEYMFAGAVWRFANEGNRRAFMAHPFVYMPRFGGYDPVGLARGVGVAGDPSQWAVTKGRLHIFHTPEARDAFLADPDGVAALADKNWPSVRVTLVP